ncbi:MAG: diiron oxygenase [Gordonia sp. (in: high G+C Gram-positive bacteria)]|uniref:AurF N-oxygenase family protein n=1 Tax=Gordonia sp. (in: high G+C Gram-positive bacteria) TaxID=84139 RepID=UPI0039E329F5
MTVVDSTATEAARDPSGGPRLYKGAVSTTSVDVGDRQKTAQRLLRSTADRSYDGELDIDWDAPIVEGAPWIPIHRLTLRGTEHWDKLTDEQKRLLTMYEAVAVLSYGIFAEVALSTNLMRGVLRNPGFVDDHTRYALAEVAEETRHSTMFGRLINKTGLKPYKQPKAVLKFFRFVGFVPMGPAIYAGTLLIEEVLDRLQREGMMDETLQPHFRQLMKIHILEEARHITYAREELVRSIQARGRMSNAAHRVAFALMVNFVQEQIIDPRVYRSVGLSPLRGMIDARRSPQFKETGQFMAGPLLEFLYDAGMIKGPVTTRLYKLSGALPPDLRAKVDADRRR